MSPSALAAPQPSATLHRLTANWQAEWKRSVAGELPPADRIENVCAWFGFASPSKLPRPGGVAGWKLREWQDFAASFGLIEGEKSKHSFVFIHPFMPRVRLCPATSPGDSHAPMNQMQDFRLLYRTEIGRLLACAIATAEEIAADASQTLEMFAKLTEKNLRDPNFWTKNMESLESRRSSLGLTVPFSNLLKLLKILRTEFSLSSRQSIEKLHVSPEESTLILRYASSGDLMVAANAEVSAEIVDALRDVLEQMRAAESQLRERRQRERDERNKPKASDQPPATLVTPRTPEQVYNEELARVGKNIVIQSDIVREALKRLESLAMPVFPGADLAAVQAMTAERDAAMTSKATAEHELLMEREKSLRLRETILEIEQTDPWESRMREFSAKLAGLLADNDITKLIFNLDEARKLVAEAVALTAVPAVPAVTPNSAAA